MNDSLKTKYKKIVSKFDSKKERFKRVIESWRTKNKQDLVLQYSSLMAEAEKIKSDLLVFFSVEHTDVSDETQREIKAKIKRFKTIYKQLNQNTKPLLLQWIEAFVVALIFAIILRNLAFSLYHVPTGSAEKTILVGDRLWGNKMAYFFNDIKRGDLVIFDDPRTGYDESSKIQAFWQRYVGIPIPLLGLKKGPINVVKRVIAVPGDVIEGKIENGKTVIYLNGKKLDEPYVNPYPLILLYRDKGFFNTNYLGIFKVPEALKKEQKLVRYTYDPAKQYDQQPFYYMNEKDIYKDPKTGKPVLFEAYAPTYYGFGLSIDEFGPRTIPADMYWVMGDSRKNSEDSRVWQYLPKKYIHGKASFIIYSIDSEESFWIFDLIKHPIDFWKKSVRWNRFFKKIE